MRFDPPPTLLYSFRGDRVNYQSLLCEAVDNSFDAGAQRIAIQINDQRIIFEDNGIGVTRDRIPALFSPGEHAAMAGTQLGRFGIGIKAQAINAADVITVDSTSRDGTFRASVNWRSVLRRGVWEADDPTWRPTVVGASTGTRIELTALRTASKYTIEKLLEELALRFHPALSAHRQIVLNGHAVPYLKDPKLTDIVERDISLTAGRTARIRGGLLAEPSKLWGVHVGFQHRIIMPKDRIGCSDYGGISQMFARVQLSGPWHLGKFKDQLVDEDERDELESALELVLEPILEKCNSASLDTKIAELGELINEGLPESIAAARPHRRKPKTDVTAKTKQKKKSNGRVERDKADLGKGPAKTKQPQSGRLLILLEGKNDENGVGLYKPGRPDCVYLSPDNPAIDKFVQLRDQQHAADALRLIGIMMYVEGKFQRDLLRSYGRHVADLMSLNVATSRDEKLL